VIESLIRRALAHPAASFVPSNAATPRFRLETRRCAVSTGVPAGLAGRIA